MSADVIPSPAERLGHLADDLDILSALPRSSNDRAVEACPGWSVADLLVHLGRIHRWVIASMATAGGGALPPFPPRPRADAAALARWFDDGAREMTEVFSAADLDESHPTWAGERSGHWWLRRQLFENAVHRWDAQHAAGADCAPIALAADGVDEWAELQQLRSWRAPEGLHGTVHLHGTDGEGEWLLTIDDGLTVTHGHQKGDAAVRGRLSDLCLMLWGRLAPEHLEVHGDAALVERLIASF